MNDPARLWIVAYDIRDPRRLGRVGRFMSKQAMRLQYSLFAGRWTRRELGVIIGGLNAMIDARVDDVRIYPLEDQGWMARIGCQHVTPGWLHLVQPTEDPQSDEPDDGEENDAQPFEIQ